jgi:cobalt/nickel transport protein
MNRYRTLVLALLAMALLTPAGLYLPDLLKAGPAWGEWGTHDLKRMIGYAPEGMEKTAGAWKAPLPDYALPGQDEASPLRRGALYVLSALAGTALCFGAAWILARRLSVRRGRTDEEGDG